MNGDRNRIEESFWERFLGFFVENKLVVVVLVALGIGAGVATAPFQWDVGDFPREPVPVDAIPDVGENQQIIFTEWPGSSPRDVEDQITYPLTSTLLGMAGVKTVRSFSMFGFSTIYVIFEEGIDFHWSRSRVLEKLASLPPGALPEGVAPTLGPDATALGQVFWYTLEARDEEGHIVGGFGLDELRSIQDWTVRYALQSVPGVAEVASVGGFEREYQVDVDPEAMRAQGVTLPQVAAAVRGANRDVGARTVEINRVEYLVRGLGFVERTEDLETAVVATRDGVPVRVRDVAQVTMGPAPRRGALDDAGAETVGGVVVARFGANPLEIIGRVKDKIGEISPGLPRRTLDDGTVSQVRIVPFYDRSTLIYETLDTLSSALLRQILITIIVVLIMLRHLPSALLVSGILPFAVLTTFVVMRLTGVDANIMALSGIAIAIGTLVDMGIVFVENIVSRLEDAPPGESRLKTVRSAAAEVAPAVLTSVATTVVSFLPVFALGAAEGKLFRPLAYTKTFALGVSFLIAALVLPAVAHLILRRSRDGRDGPPRPLWRRLLDAIPTARTAQDGLLVAGGIALVVFVNTAVGLLVLAAGLVGFAGRGIPGRWGRFVAGLTPFFAAAAVAAVLAADWMPLGHGHSEASNLLFVVLVVALLLGLFAVVLHFYGRLLRFFLRHKLLFLSVPAVLLFLGWMAWQGFGRTFSWLPQSVQKQPALVWMAHTFPGLQDEYMPPFDEGSFLYMPTTMPHASVGQVLEMLQTMDAAVAQIPEIDRVVGKLGRVDSALDPAPVSMIETVITYHPEYRVDAEGRRLRFRYDATQDAFVRDADGELIPDPEGRPYRQWRDHIESPDDIWDEIVKAAELPGLTSAPMLMPIATRIVMLQSGMRASMGVKVRGPDLASIEQTALDIESLLKEVPGVRAETVLADRVVGKPYLEIDIDRDALGRYGLRVDDVQSVIQTAIGGRTVTRTVEGRERYGVRVRYQREERDSVEAMQRVLVATPTGQQIPLGDLTRIDYVRGPQVIRAEDAFPTAYVTFDRKRGVGELAAVEQAQAYLADKIDSGELELPAGVSFSFAGNYQNKLRSDARLRVLLPVALLVILLILYLQFRRLTTVLMIFSGIAVATTGGFLLLWLYGQPWFLDATVFGVSLRDLFQVDTVNLSVAVWVGFIALFGIATDDGVVMATYLRQRFDGERPRTRERVRDLTLEAGLRRVRPCLMTTGTTLLALLPVITSTGRGADVMIPMALPAFGGMAIELVTLFVVPVLWSAVEEWRVRRVG